MSVDRDAQPPAWAKHGAALTFLVLAVFTGAGSRLMPDAVEIVRGTLLDLGRVALAKYTGHDPYGMLFRDRSWREAIPATYKAHREAVKSRA